MKLLPETDSLKGLRGDYEEMVGAGMMYSTLPSFDEIIESIQNRESSINDW
ncbi:hypothetical protein [Marinobacter sp. LV10R510-11A]|uniref:hypothetical protein n=1 Tax=Marinobacter sp. LV10R510-11A TaxID=1415568 RepID=UPI0015D657D5|nr:hypothetical protein [Marinobacter sp. LV10R510-11A]